MQIFFPIAREGLYYPHLKKTTFTACPDSRGLFHYRGAIAAHVDLSKVGLGGGCVYGLLGIKGL